MVKKSWNGVAVFSKHSIEDVTRGLPGYPDANARMIECVIDGRIRIINVYMPNGESVDSPKFPYKIEWMNHFTRHIAQLLESEEPVVIGGDFNVAIQDRDVWNPKQYEGSSISAPVAREIMQKWLDAGWQDCYRRFNPDAENAWTWIGYRGAGLQKNQGLRLDYWLANKAAQKLVKNCDIDLCPRMDDKPTDHCGLVYIFSTAPYSSNKLYPREKLLRFGHSIIIFSIDGADQFLPIQRHHKFCINQMRPS